MGDVFKLFFPKKREKIPKKGKKSQKKGKNPKKREKIPKKSSVLFIKNTSFLTLFIQGRIISSQFINNFLDF